MASTTIVVLPTAVLPTDKQGTTPLEVTRRLSRLELNRLEILLLMGSMPAMSGALWVLSVEYHSRTGGGYSGSRSDTTGVPRRAPPAVLGAFCPSHPPPRTRRTSVRTLGARVRHVSLATSADARLRRPVGLTALRTRQCLWVSTETGIMDARIQSSSIAPHSRNARGRKWPLHLLCATK